jgi:predicted O-methyltransferase YrrM
MAAARVSTLPAKAVRAATSRLSLWQLQRSASATARQVADAMRAAAHDEFSAESRAWFRRIEALREHVAQSTERVEVVDYGAGLPSSTRTDDEMLHGSISRPELGRLARTTSLPRSLGRFLHAVVASTGARRGIELGTCVGISAAYQASALDTHDDASFVTCEGAPALAAVADHNLRRLGLRRCRVVSGRFADTLPGVAAELQPIDYAFIDGHHDEAATVRYNETLRPHLAPRAVLVFDDIRWSAVMTRAWNTIRTTPGNTAAADLGRLGLVVVERSV